MIQFYLNNIQSIKEHQFNFEDTGIIQFKGNNSNGKSILVKVLRAVVLQQLARDEKRLPLINDNCEMGKFAVAYNGQVLMVILHRDINRTCYMLKRKNGEQITRHVRDGGIDKLLQEFGFCIFGKNDICLQFCETYGLMPFINTPESIDSQIVNSVTTDETSEHFLEAYQQTYKEAQRQYKSYQAELSTVEARLAGIQIHDTHDYKELITIAERLLKIHEYMKPIEKLALHEKPEPVVRMMPLSNLPLLHKPEDLVKMSFMKKLSGQMPPLHVSISARLKSLDSLLEKIAVIDAGKCPTCGQRLESCNHDR